MHVQHARVKVKYNAEYDDNSASVGLENLSVELSMLAELVHKAQIKAMKQESLRYVDMLEVAA
jgi:hypothetical protein